MVILQIEKIALWGFGSLFIAPIPYVLFVLPRINY